MVGGPRTRKNIIWCCDSYGGKFMNKIGYVSKYSFYLWLSPRSRLMWYQEVPVLESANKCIELRLKWNESVNTGECWNMSKLSLCVVVFKE